MSTYYVKRGDVGAPTPETFLEDGRGDAVNLTGATVRFLMRAAGAASPKVDTAGTIVDAVTGQVEYTWVAGDLDTAGIFRAEWEVTFAGGAKQTFPANGWISVLVWSDLES